MKTSTIESNSKLSYAQVQEIYNVLLNTSVKNKANMTTAKNLMKLKPHVDSCGLLQQKLIKKYGDGKEEMTTDHPNFQVFWKEYQENLVTKTDFDIGSLAPISEDDIDCTRANQNQIFVLMSHGLIK